jgi:hypothetical protein
LGLIILLAFLAVVNAGPQPISPPAIRFEGTEFRAIAFLYTNGKYERVVDVLDNSFATREACSAALVKVLPGLKLAPGDFAAAACAPIPRVKAAIAT